MIDFTRKCLALLHKRLEKNTVLVLYGPRRVGKTTLLEKFKNELGPAFSVKMVNAETSLAEKELSSNAIDQLKTYLGSANVLIIDEAQHIPNIGKTLKLLVDSMPGLSIIASGSASLDLAQKGGEPLTGRKKTLHLYPLSAEEIIQTTSRDQYLSWLPQLLIFGSYPKLFSLPSLEEKKMYLEELSTDYLFKDILSLENIKNSRKLRDLLTLLAFQIGQEVSLSELGTSLGLRKETVARYLDLCEKAFIIINIRGLSRNLRTEVSKTSRYYFYDLGIRNALINNYNHLDLRNDVGMLWENYIVLERLKKQHYDGVLSHNYFWRTYDQKEIDWVEERDGKLFGYEITWSKKTKKIPKLFLENYPGASVEVIQPDNFFSFVADHVSSSKSTSF